MKIKPLHLMIFVFSFFLIHAGVFAESPEVTEIVDSFFKAVQEGNLTKAYDNYLSEEFKNVASREEFGAFLEQNQWINYKKTEWDSVILRQVTIDGKITTVNDISIPLNIFLVMENGAWKIQSIYREAGQDSTGQQIMPSDNELLAMADTATQRLGRAINARDFTEFYNNLADLFKSQTTPEALYNAFKSFADQSIDLTTLKGIKPVFNIPPAVDGNGILVLKGYYPSQPPIVYFEIKYIYEHPDWRLFGVNLSVR